MTCKYIITYKLFFSEFWPEIIQMNPALSLDSLNQPPTQ